MQPLHILALSDGCMALFDYPVEFPMEGDITFQYRPDCLLITYCGMEVLVPAAFFDHMFASAFDVSDGGRMVNVHLYWCEEGVYEAVFAGSLSIEAETFMKAKGVAEYLSTATPS